jgi:hypothetical protein
MTRRADSDPRTTAPPVRVPAHRRPDPRPMRLAVAAGAAATISALLALVGGSALATAAPPTTTGPATGGAFDIAPLRHVVRVVVLPPGQLPPTGASAAPGSLAVPVSPPAVARQPKVRTSQSGRP